MARGAFCGLKKQAKENHTYKVSALGFDCFLTLAIARRQFKPKHVNLIERLSVKITGRVVQPRACPARATRSTLGVVDRNIDRQSAL